MFRISLTNLCQKNLKSSYYLGRKVLFFNNINHYRFNSATMSTSKLTNFDGLVLGSYKDGSLSEATSKELSNNVQQTIKQQLQCAGVKGDLSEVRVLYGIGKEEGLPSKIAVVSLGTKSENLKESLNKARVAVYFISVTCYTVCHMINCCVITNFKNCRLLRVFVPYVIKELRILLLML
jgi:hypothetical protein